MKRNACTAGERYVPRPYNLLLSDSASMDRRPIRPSFQASTDNSPQGLIISISVLIAAGFAVYENPQVRQWVDSSRRKIAIALHSLGDEITPPSGSQSSQLDASTREDESPEAVIRRWKARQEILERGRMMEQRRRPKQEATGKATSFDDLVDQDGVLKREEEEATAKTTATESQVESSASGLHKRNTELAGVVLGATLANPFSDEWHTDTFSTTSESIPTHKSPSSPSTLAADIPPPVPPKLPLHPPHPQTQPRLLIDTDDLSTHPSEQLLDLTPTTASSSSFAAARDHQPSNYWSVHEWAETTAPSFYSPPQSDAGVAAAAWQRENETASAGEKGSQVVVGEETSVVGSDVSDLDVVSEASEGMRTPGSWTEVGSVVSEGF